MQRGGVLILIIGVILIVGAVAIVFLFFMQPTGGGLIGAAPTPEPPTEVPDVEIVRARVDIQANTVIQEDQLQVVTIKQNEFDPQQNLSRTSDVVGKLTTRAFRAGQAIVASALTEPGLSQQLPTAEPNRPRDKAYPLVVNNLSGVADQISVGDFVDVVATFSVTRRVSYPAGADERGITRELADREFFSTKTLVQNVQVLKILRPAAAEATPDPAAEGSLPAVDETGQPVEGGQTGATMPSGAWTLILAMNNQEIELVEFALASRARVVLVLRGAGDTAFQSTIGATMDLLISEFGVPLPYFLPPHVISEDTAFTPEPTRTPAPTRVP